MGTSRCPEVEHLLSLFDYSHLSPDLKGIAHPFWSVAYEMADHFDHDGFELIVGLRKLLEAKDCFVRQEVVVQKRSRASG